MSFFLITCLLDIVLVQLGEILSWSFTMSESWRFMLTWDIILNQLFPLTKGKQTNASKCFFFYCLCFPSYRLVLTVFPWLSWTYEEAEATRELILSTQHSICQHHEHSQTLIFKEISDFKVNIISSKVYQKTVFLVRSESAFTLVVVF